MMKTICLYSLLSLLPLAPAAAQGVQRLQSGATVSDVTISKQRDSVVIHMNIGLSDAEIARNRSVMITPLLYSDKERAWLPVVQVMGRRQYLYYQRNEESWYAEHPYAVVKHQKENRQQVDYRIALPYRQWMDKAELAVTEDNCGCGEVTQGNRILLALFQHIPQKAAQIMHRRLGLFLVNRNQRIDIIERIEQEVRMQLLPQAVQFHFVLFLFESLAFHLHPIPASHGTDSQRKAHNQDKTDKIGKQEQPSHRTWPPGRNRIRFAENQIHQILLPEMHQHHRCPDTQQINQEIPHHLAGKQITPYQEKIIEIEQAKTQKGTNQITHVKAPEIRDVRMRKDQRPAKEHHPDAYMYQYHHVPVASARRKGPLIHNAMLLSDRGWQPSWPDTNQRTPQ